MASVALSTKAVGSTVQLKVGGTLRDFIVVHQGKPGSMYDESCNVSVKFPPTLPDQRGNEKIQ